MSTVTPPVPLALSWVPTTDQPVAAPQKGAVKPAAQAETITCPITGEQIPACCCPVKK